MDERIQISFRCYFPTGEPCDKVQEIYLWEIPKWIECYLFTHPACTAVSVRVLAKNWRN